MPKNEINFAKLNTELETILTQLDSGDLDIDTAIKEYERGMEIVKQLDVYLKEAENKVTKIKAKWGSSQTK